MVLSGNIVCMTGCYGAFLFHIVMGPAHNNVNRHQLHILLEKFRCAVNVNILFTNCQLSHFQKRVTGIH